MERCRYTHEQNNRNQGIRWTCCTKAMTYQWYYALNNYIHTGIAIYVRGNKLNQQLLCITLLTCASPMHFTSLIDQLERVNISAFEIVYFYFIKKNIHCTWFFECFTLQITVDVVLVYLLLLHWHVCIVSLYGNSLLNKCKLSMAYINRLADINKT